MEPIYVVVEHHYDGPVFDGLYLSRTKALEALHALRISGSIYVYKAEGFDEPVRVNTVDHTPVAEMRKETNASPE